MLNEVSSGNLTVRPDKKVGPFLYLKTPDVLNIEPEHIMKKKPNNKDKKPFSFKDFPKLPDDHPLFTRGFTIGGRGFNRSRKVKEEKED